MLHASLEIATYGDSGKFCSCGAHVFHGPLWNAASEALARKLHLLGFQTNHITKIRGLCHKWNDYEEFVMNRDAERVGLDDYEKYM